MNVLKLAVVRKNTDIGDGYRNFPEVSIGRRLLERRVSARRFRHVDEGATDARVRRLQGRVKGFEIQPPRARPGFSDFERERGTSRGRCPGT